MNIILFNESTKKLSKQRSRLPQYISTAAVSLGGFCMGNTLGWSSPALPQLIGSNHFSNLTINEQSWIGSLATVGAFLAVIPAGIIMEHFGRKFPMFISSVCFIFGWLCIVIAKQIWMLYAGRFLTDILKSYSGIGTGIMSLVGPIYLTEISDSEIRGRTGVAFQLALVVGMLSSSVLGFVSNWKWLSIASTIVPVLFAVAIVFIPQSPRFLLKTGCSSEATKVMARLRSSDPENPSREVIEELRITENSINNSKQNPLSLKDLWATSLFQPIVITLCLILFSQVCGMSAVNFYTVQLFDDAGTGINSYVSSIVVGVVQVLGVIFASFLVDKIGRRILLISSFILMHISLVSLGIFFYMKKIEASQPQQSEFVLISISWLPLSSIILFNVGNRIGVASLVWTVMGEIIPSNILEPIYTLETAYSWILAFLITKFFTILNSTLEIQNTFWLLSGCNLLGAVFVYFMVPETKGKSLAEIQEEYFKTDLKKLKHKGLAVLSFNKL